MTAGDSSAMTSPEYRQFIEDLKARVISARISAARAMNRDFILSSFNLWRMRQLNLEYSSSEFLAQAVPELEKPFGKFLAQPVPELASSRQRCGRVSTSGLPLPNRPAADCSLPTAWLPAHLRFVRSVRFV